MTDREGKTQRIIKALVALEPADTSGTYARITPEQGDEIARMFEGDFGLFQELDDGPGRYTDPFYHDVDSVYTYDHWHYKLRQARNDRRNRFFEILAGRE